MLPPLPHTPTHIAALRELLSLSDSSFPKHWRKRLLVLLRLCEEKRIKEIILEVGLSRQRISTIRKECTERGVDLEIEEAKAWIRSGSAGTESGEKRHQGRPGFSTLTEWTEAQRFEDEPVVELLVLALSRTIRCAVIGVRLNGAKDDLERKRDLKGLLEPIKAGLNTSEEADWTCNGVDFTAQYLFPRLREDVARLTEFSPDLDVLSRDFCEEFLDGYSDRWRFVILDAGDRFLFDSACPHYAARISERVTIPYDAFFDRLERLVYHLRVTENFLGLFPAFDRLRAHVWDRELNEPQTPIFWRISEAEVNEAVARRQVDFYVNALSGMVFELPFRLRKMISIRERFPIAPITLRPKFDIVGTRTENRGVVAYQPIPQIGRRYSLEITDGKQIGKSLRTLFRSGKGRLALDYSVRLEKDHVLTAYPDTLELDFSSDASARRVAVVSVPRQWLMEPPALPVHEVVAWANSEKQIATHRQKNDGGLLLFRPPGLLEAIWDAFQGNRYGDRVEVLRVAQHKIKNALSGVRPPNWLPVPYYFSDDQLSGRDISRATFYRLTKSPLALGDRRDFGHPKNPQESLYPDYEPQKTFKQLLTEYDADFLLREIDESAWLELKKSTEEWATLCTRVIFEKYWPGSHVADDLILQAVPLSWRRIAVQRREDVRDWSSDALRRFSADTPRVLRSAVETGQRCVLAKLPPVLAAVLTEDDLFRSWKSYLGRYLAGRFTDAFNEQKERGPNESVLNRRDLSIEETDDQEPWP